MAYTRRESLFMGKIEKNVPKGKDEENAAESKEEVQEKVNTVHSPSPSSP